MKLNVPPATVAALDQRIAYVQQALTRYVKRARGALTTEEPPPDSTTVIAWIATSIHDHAHGQPDAEEKLIDLLAAAIHRLARQEGQP